MISPWSVKSAYLAFLFCQPNGQSPVPDNYSDNLQIGYKISIGAR
jgi:hypothetical protein